VSPAAGAAPANTTSPNGAVSTYLQMRAHARVEGVPVASLRARFAPGSPAVQREVLSAQGYRLVHEQLGEHPAAGTCHVRRLSVQVAGTTAMASVEEETDVTIAANERPFEGAVINHTVSMSLVSGQWLIVQDEYTDQGSGWYLKAAHAPAGMIAEARRKTDKLHRAEQQANALSAAFWSVTRLPAAVPLDDPPPKVSAYFDYNRTHAISYAYAWWNRYNVSKYNNHSGSGGDCANFVSQCLADSTGGALRMFGSSGDPSAECWRFNYSTKAESASWSSCTWQSRALRHRYPVWSNAYISAWSRTVPSGYRSSDIAWCGTEQPSTPPDYFSTGHAVFCVGTDADHHFLFTSHSGGDQVYGEPIAYYGFSSQRYGHITDRIYVL
jgi:hypothetical protein